MWANLPEELLSLIAQRLDSDFDVLRFRSVCSPWRSSVPSRPRFIPENLRVIPSTGLSSIVSSWHLSKRSILQLGLPEATPNSWLINIEEDQSGEARLLHPLVNFKCELPPKFPRIFDFSGFTVLELGQEYILETDHFIWQGKAAFWSGNGSGFWLLKSNSSTLDLFRCDKNRWMRIDCTDSLYQDVIFFNGKFYAVDGTGRTVVVVLDDLSRPTLKLVAGPEFNGEKKRLIEMEGELLLVDMFVDNKINVFFKVFKFDEVRQIWIQIKDLRDRMLFLADESSFSARASDFYGCKGKCIYFRSVYVEGFQGLYDLESNGFGPLANYENNSKVIWPPPAWVTSSYSQTY